MTRSNSTANMFQSFENFPVVANADRIADLRNAMQRAKVDAYLVPRSDEFQGEYVPGCAERLFWLTGFSGSAGSAVIAARSAALIVDGRYTVQAAMQVDAEIFDIVQQPPGSMTDWIIKTVGKMDQPIVGYDPWLMTMSQVETIGKKLRDHGIALKPVTSNLVDKLWGRDRPPEPDGPIVSHPRKFSGERASKKVERFQQELRNADENACVITLPDSVSWLFNLRANDVPHNPVVRAFAILPAKGSATIFIDPARVSPDARKSLDKIARFKPADSFADALKKLKEQKKTVRISPATTPYAVERALNAKQINRASDPCIAWKAVKNPVEIAGSRTAHERDGVAMCRFLAWLDENGASGELTEISAAAQLEEFRKATGALKEISFDTISGFGPNGAIVHYRVTEATNRKLTGKGLYLVDSGGQYLDGTTDITRTIPIGEPTKAMRAAFTRVLQGHIAIATAVFPKGTRGVDIDAFARAPLWKAGLDYDHGTGHGVGSYLSVHEGPQGISRRAMTEFEPGMIVSNEPGYYKEGAFGIRIENLVLVREPEIPPGGDREMLSFETLTLAPIDTRLVDARIMMDSEIAWLNAYHTTVRKTLSPHLSASEKAWLKQATAAI